MTLLLSVCMCVQVQAVFMPVVHGAYALWSWWMWQHQRACAAQQGGTSVPVGMEGPVDVSQPSRRVVALQIAGCM